MAHVLNKFFNIVGFNKPWPKSIDKMLNPSIIKQSINQSYFISGMAVAPVKVVGCFSCRTHYDWLTNKL